MTNDLIGGISPIATEMTCWQLFRDRLSSLGTKLCRKLPMLVWYGDDVDIRITFTDLRLAPECTLENLRYEGDMETLWRAEAALHQLGLTFDAGTGPDGRDWEFDWSLRGPVRIEFRRRHAGDRKPRNVREMRPALRLVKCDKGES